MRRLGLISLAIFSLWGWTASAQVFPNIPANTVLGRLGSGNPGPPQPIPFSSLSTIINIGCNLLPSGCALIFGYINPIWFGADPTGSSDNATAINTVLTSATTNKQSIYFPCGTYKVASALSATIPSTWTLSISGPSSDCVILNFTTNAGLTLNYTDQYSASRISGITFAAGTTASGFGLKYAQTTSNANPALSAQSLLSGVTFRGFDGYGATNYFATMVVVQNVSNINFISDMYIGGGSNGVGVSLVGLPASSTYGVAYNFTNNTWVDGNINITYGSYIQGVTVESSNFTGGVDAISIGSGLTGTLAQLSVTNSQIATQTGCVSGGTLLFDFVFTHNVVGTSTNSTSCVAGIFQYYTIAGNVFGGTGSGNGSNAVVLSSGSTDGTIANNTIYAWAGGIVLVSGSSNAYLQANNLQANGTPISDGGTGTVGNTAFQVQLLGSSSGIGTLKAPVAASTFTWTLPSATGILVGSGDTGTVTNAMLAGSITNAKLVNSATTVNGQTCTLGSTCTVTATASSSLTIGTHLTGASYNGSAPVTIATDAVSTNTASTLVARDGSGNFSAGTITASLTGHASLDLALTGGSLSGTNVNLTLTGGTSSGQGPYVIWTDTTPQNIGAIGKEAVLLGSGTSSNLFINAYQTALDFGVGGTVIASLTSGGLTIPNQQFFMPSITTSSSAATGTVCWTTSTGKFTADTTVGCLTSLAKAKHIDAALSPRYALNIIERLKPISFHYKNGWGDSGHYEQFGFTADQAATIDERLVGRDPNGELQGFRYQEYGAVLTAAMQALKADNDNLHAELTELKRRIAR